MPTPSLTPSFSFFLASSHSPFPLYAFSHATFALFFSRPDAGNTRSPVPHPFLLFPTSLFVPYLAFWVRCLTGITSHYTSALAGPSAAPPPGLPPQFASCRQPPDVLDLRGASSPSYSLLHPVLNSVSEKWRVFLPFPVLHSCSLHLPPSASGAPCPTRGGPCDLQLCLLSTQTSVRTAGRTREGQTAENMGAHGLVSTNTHKKRTHAKRASTHISLKERYARI